MEVGNIVEYIDRQQIVCAVVVEIKNQRLRLLSETNKEIKLSANRVLHRANGGLDLAGGRDRVVHQLKSIARKRRELTGDVAVRDLWEVLNSEQEWVDLATLTALCFPENPSSDHESAVMRALFDDRLYFKFSPEGFFPNDEEQVERLAVQRREEERRTRLISRGSQWLAHAGAGSKPADGGVDAAAAADILKAYFLFGKESTDHPIAQAILKECRLEKSERLFTVLVKAGIFDEDENIELQRYGFCAEFPVEVSRQAAVLAGVRQKTGFCDGRRDLTGLRLITIDGQATLDFDDAISLEPDGNLYRVGIHIADVGHAVAKGDLIDQEALARASSIYMPDRKISMLPPELAEGLCSLKAGALRPAISNLVTIGPDYHILDYEVIASTVQVSDQLTYSEVNVAAEDDEHIPALLRIAEAFRSRRLQAGAVQITLPEINIWLGEGGEVNLGRVNRDSPSRLLVSELMILGNWLMARKLAEHAMPAVFRSQTEPRVRLYEGDEGSPFQNWMQRRHLSRFLLGHAPEKHAGLGLDMYVTATSPIRKYVDLVTQRQLRALLGLEAAYSAEEIDAIIQQLELPMSQVARVQFLRHRYWLLKHLAKQAGQKLEATVLMKRRMGVQVLLNDYMIECDLPTPPALDLKPEDLIQVTIQRVNPRDDEIVLSLG